MVHFGIVTMWMLRFLDQEIFISRDAAKLINYLGVSALLLYFSEESECVSEITACAGHHFEQ